jgi:hypothetical protein
MTLDDCFGTGDPADSLTPVLAHPQTGEVLTLTDLATDPLLELQAEVVGLLDRARDARRQVEDEMERRRRAQGGSAKQVRGDTLSATKSVTRKWSEPGAISALQYLAEKGVVPVAEADALVPERTVRKPDGRGLNALVTRLIDNGHVEDAQVLLEARSEFAKWSVEEA